MSKQEMAQILQCPIYTLVAKVREKQEGFQSNPPLSPAQMFEHFEFMLKAFLHLKPPFVISISRAGGCKPSLPDVYLID